MSGGLHREVMKPTSRRRVRRARFLTTRGESCRYKKKKERKTGVGFCIRLKYWCDFMISNVPYIYTYIYSLAGF